MVPCWTRLGVPLVANSYQRTREVEKPSSGSLTFWADTSMPCPLIIRHSACENVVSLLATEKGSPGWLAGAGNPYGLTGMFVSTNVGLLLSSLVRVTTRAAWPLPYPASSTRYIGM